MKSGLVQLSVALSHLVPSRRNPRKVKPSREAHQRLVALIRSQDLLQPLVVRPIEDKPKYFEVVAGERRWRALKEIHRGDGDPKIPCNMCEMLSPMLGSIPSTHSSTYPFCQSRQSAMTCLVSGFLSNVRHSWKPRPKRSKVNARR